MSTFQMIMLAVGVLVGVSTYWSQIKTLKHPKEPDHRNYPLDSLAEVVVCWEHLQDELKKRGLDKAAAELTTIFQLFIEAVKEDEVKPQPGV